MHTPSRVMSYDSCGNECCMGMALLGGFIVGYIAELQAIV